MVSTTSSNPLKWHLFSALVLWLISILSLGCSASKSESGWPNPRFDLTNTAANKDVSCNLLDQPQLRFQVTLDAGSIPYTLFPVSADIDQDGKLEYLLNGWNWNQPDEYWLAAFNVDDGTMLWRDSFRGMLLWSTPVASDIDKDDELEIVLATDNEVIVLQGSDGSVVWTRPFPGGKGMAVADIHRGGNQEIIINDKGAPHWLHLLSGDDGTQIWKQPTGGSAYNLPVAVDLDGDGDLEILGHHHRYDPSREELLVWSQDGEQLWSYAASPSPDQELNSPAELGWVPDFGYISTTVADFNADGDLEIGWGTRCHYYLLNQEGKLLWRVPLIEGFGNLRIHHRDGTIEADTHGTGGPHGYAAAVGDLDGDPGLEIVLGFEPEYIADYYEETGAFVYEQVNPANLLRAYNGEDGSLLWSVEGQYLSEDRIAIMHEPLLVDVTGDGLLDVLALSSDRHLYIVRGIDGMQLIDYHLGPDEDELFWVAHHLTFVVDGSAGIVLFNTGTDSTSPPTTTLHALQVADECR